jgi:acyl carrier protein
MTVMTDQALFDVVREAVMTVLAGAHAGLQPETRLVEDLGADSLALIEIVEISEERLRGQGLPVWIEDEVLSRMAVLGDLVTALRLDTQR